MRDVTYHPSKDTKVEVAGSGTNYMAWISNLDGSNVTLSYTAVSEAQAMKKFVEYNEGVTAGAIGFHTTKVVDEEADTN